MAPRRFAYPLIACLFGLGFAACTGASSSGSTSTSAGAGGSGGAASSESSSVATSSASGEPDAGPLTCKGDVTNIPGQCDLLAQDCGPGKTCIPASKMLGAPLLTTCVNAPGVKSEGEHCDGQTECRSGLACISNQCAPFCCQSSGEPCLGHVCGFTVQYGGNLYARACRYSRQCQVLTADACPAGLDCHVDDVKFGVATCGARSMNAVPEFGACGFSNDCDDMQQCTPAAGDMGPHCHTLCWTKGPLKGNPKGLGGCDAGETCAPASLGVDDLGLCVK